MKKIIEICIGVLVVVGIGIVIVFKIFFATDTQTPTNLATDNSNTAPVTAGQPTYGNTYSVSTVEGGTILTKDFKKDSATGKYPTPGYYYIGPHAPIDGVSDRAAIDNPPYIILYIDSTQYFNIELLQQPIAGARTQAEQYLMGKLGISQSQMCQLKYDVAVPYSVDQTHTGTNLGFSFCPGAVALP